MGCAQGKKDIEAALRNASRMGNFLAVLRMLDKGTDPNSFDEV